MEPEGEEDEAEALGGGPLALRVRVDVARRGFRACTGRALGHRTSGKRLLSNIEACGSRLGKVG
jgi:hypothetical protein